MKNPWRRGQLVGGKHWDTQINKVGLRLQLVWAPRLHVHILNKVSIYLITEFKLVINFLKAPC